MSGENHEGNKSPDICDNDNQRRFLCPQTMKHEAMKAYETQGSALEGEKKESSQIHNGSTEKEWIHRRTGAFIMVRMMVRTSNSKENAIAINLTCLYSSGEQEPIKGAPLSIEFNYICLVIAKKQSLR
jgi:hypothetical protein